jgi:hypothetical protein
MNQEASDCSNCSLLRSNLSDVMRRLGDHDMLVRMLDLATKQRDLLQKQLSTAVENEANCKRDCAAMQVRSLLSSSCFMIRFFTKHLAKPPHFMHQHYQRECATLRQRLQSVEVKLMHFFSCEHLLFIRRCRPT